MKVFLDTNVLIAAFATRGLCEDVLRTVLTQHELVVGTAVLIELERILIKRLRIPSRKAKTIVAFIRSQAEVVNPKAAVPWPESDADDRWIAAAALDGNAEILVTGDRDLLDMVSEVPISIVSPRGFWERLR